MSSRRSYQTLQGISMKQTKNKQQGTDAITTVQETDAINNKGRTPEAKKEFTNNCKGFVWLRLELGLRLEKELVFA